MTADEPGSVVPALDRTRMQCPTCGSPHVSWERVTPLRHARSSAVRGIMAETTALDTTACTSCRHVVQARRLVPRMSEADGGVGPHGDPLDIPRPHELGIDVGLPGSAVDRSTLRCLVCGHDRFRWGRTHDAALRLFETATCDRCRHVLLFEAAFPA